MKKAFKSLVLCVLISAMMFSIPNSGLFNVIAESDFVTITEKVIAPGVNYREEWHSNYIESGKMQNINIVQADLSNPDIKLITTKSTMLLSPKKASQARPGAKSQKVKIS